MKSILILTGPTAVGKTEISLVLAERADAEIISADSRQIYRHIDIGTAKPPKAALKRVPHHFISELELGESFSAGQFQKAAYSRIEEIKRRKRTPVVVGGSTLYIHALKHGLADIPSVPKSIRAEIEARLADRGAEALYERLQQVDPAAAETMDATKTQRLIRALEVYEATGRPLTSYFDDQREPPYDFTTVVLTRDRADLYRRINDRVDAMLEDGLLEEVASLHSRGFDRSINPLRTIGYQEPLAYLEGEMPHEEMVRLMKRNTRRYAKRQLTWFRRDPENVWLNAAGPVDHLTSEISSIAW